MSVDVCEVYRRLGGESNQEIVFVSFVRASEAACGRETTLLPMLGFGRKQRAPTFRSVPRALPSPSQNHSLAVCWLTNRCKSLLIDSKSFRVASRCFSLLPAAFPLRLGWKNCKSRRLDPQCCWPGLSVSLLVNRC